MKGKGNSVSKSQSKKKNSQRDKILEDEHIDEIMKDITLKRPRNAFTQFVMAEVEKFKSKNKGKKFSMRDNIKDLHGKWTDLSESEKKRYKKLYEDEKEKYRNDLELVRHYLFKDFNDTVLRAPTAYRIFLQEKMREGFEKGINPKEVKAEASKDWKLMSVEEKQVYLDRKKENDDWFEKAKKIKKVTPLSIFVSRTIQAAKDKHKEPPTLKEIAPSWQKLPEKEKDKYKEYADEINEERSHLQDLYDITHGVKPKRPAGAYRIFLQEKAKLDELSSIAEGKKMWEKLSDDEKESYVTKARRTQLAYRYKKMIYNKKIKKLLPKRPGTAVNQFIKEKKGQKPANGEKFVVYWREVYNSLSDSQKQKYEKKAEEARARYQKKLEEFKSKVFDFPKKPKSGFVLYVTDRMPDLKKDNEGKKANELIKIIAKEWKQEKGVSQEEYMKKSLIDQKRFKRQLKEFEQFGYYSLGGKKKATKRKGKEDDEEEDDEEDDEEEDEEETKKTKKRKGRKSNASSKVSTKKTKKKSKTQSTRSRSKTKSRSKSKTTQKSKSRGKSGKSQRARK